MKIIPFLAIEGLLEQWQQGSLSMADLLALVQLHPVQVACLDLHRKLPQNIAQKISLTDWDPFVYDTLRARGELEEV